MAIVSQILISLILATITCVVMSLLYEQILSCHTLNLESSIDDYLPGGSFVDIMETMYKFGILYGLSISACEVELLS